MNTAVLPLVDCHFHVFEAGEAVTSARYRPAYSASLADWQSLVGRLGAPYGVVVQTSFMGTDNGSLLEALRAMPEQLRGVAVVDPTVTDAALQDMHDAGVRGIRLNLYGDADWRRIGNPQWRALFARLARLGWHVELHTDNGAGEVVLAELDAALGDLAVPVVLDHFGRPGAAGPEDRVFATAAAVRARRDVWVKISAPYRLHDPARWQALALRWLEVAGADRLLWGSDWPWTNHERAGRAQECRALSQWPLAADAPTAAPRNGQTLAEAFRWGNAAALYGFDLPRPGAA